MEKHRFENLVENGPEQNIPGFEHLSEKDKKFVLEIKHLSEISEEEFFKENPKLARMKKKIDATYHERYYGEKASVYSAVRTLWLFLSSPRMLKHEGMGDLDKPSFWSTMWELTKLHLFELEDFHKFGPGFYSKQTAFLADQLAQRIDDLDFDTFLPDQYRGGQIFRNIPNDTKGQLAKISVILNIFHQKSSRMGGMPVGLRGVKDLWRYIVLHMPYVHLDKSGHDQWYDAMRQFWDQLSNISWKEDQK